ncbi:MAG: hypothetical protein ABJA81_07850 [Nocardioidaceae bacterium]
MDQGSETLTAAGSAAGLLCDAAETLAKLSAADPSMLDVEGLGDRLVEDETTPTAP